MTSQSRTQQQVGGYGVAPVSISPSGGVSAMPSAAFKSSSVYSHSSLSVTNYHAQLSPIASPSPIINGSNTVVMRHDNDEDDEKAESSVGEAGDNQEPIGDSWVLSGLVLMALFVRIYKKKLLI